jgi:hypothetical protein
MNDARDLRIELLPGVSVEAKIWLAYVAGEDLNPRTVSLGKERIGALTAEFAGPVANDEGQREGRILIEKLAYQVHTQKASSAGYEEEFIILHLRADLNTLQVPPGRLSMKFS